MVDIAFKAARKFNAAQSGFDVTIRQTPDTMPVNEEIIKSPILIILVIFLGLLLVDIITRFCKVWKTRQLLTTMVQNGL